MSKNKAQQLQFFRDCLFSDSCLGSKPDGLDLKALVDSRLTVEENWFENIRPKLCLLQDPGSKYESIGEDFVRAEIEKYKFLADKSVGVELEQVVSEVETDVKSMKGFE